MDSENNLFTPPRRKPQKVSLSLNDQLKWDPTKARVEEIDLPRTKYKDIEGGDYAVMIHGLLTEEECQHWIDASESKGYEPADVSGTMMPKVRNNDRSMIDDKNVADILYERILSILRLLNTEEASTEVKNEEMEKYGNEATTRVYKHDKESEPLVMRGKHHAQRLNNRFRFLRYDPGTYFKPHEDGRYHHVPDGTRSMVTVQIYLNEGFKGGETNILEPCANEDGTTIIKSVIPRTGSALLFDQSTMHEGAELIEGRKYTARTEIMYKMYD